MKKTKTLSLFAVISFMLFFQFTSYADVTITTIPLATGSIPQGTVNAPVYIFQVTTTGSSTTLSSLQVTLNGSYDADDISSVQLYENMTSPTISGASFVGFDNTAAAGPHTFTLGGGSRSLTAGTTVYFIVTVTVNSNATDNHTISVNGGTNPVILSFGGVTTVVNNQSNLSNTQTIQAADVTYSSIAVPAGDISQGTTSNVVYILQASVATADVNISSLQVTLDGTYDNNDLSQLAVYYNPTAPTFSGSGFAGFVTTSFAGPHTYTTSSFSRIITAGSTGYFIIVVNAVSDATDNHTVFVNGAVNPVTLTYSTAPNFVNNQTNNAGVQTIQAADVTYTSIAVPAGNIAQATTDNIVYILQASVATTSVSVSGLQVTLSGSYDNNDLSQLDVYYNPTAPTLSGAGFAGFVTLSFAGPHTYMTSGFSRILNAGTTGYFILAVNSNSDATDNHTVTVDGAANPVTLAFTTSPNFVNSQTNNAGIQTIQASDITYTSVPVAAGNIVQSSLNNIVYILKVDAATASVNINNLQITLTGTHDNDDLTQLNVYYNPTAPTLSGSSFAGFALANFAAPHTYTSSNFARTLNAGSTGYFIITVDASAGATNNNTVIVDGAANPVILSFPTSPNIANNQTNAAGVQTIIAAGITLTTTAIPAGNIFQGTIDNPIYILSANAIATSANVTGMNVTLSGTHDADDITQLDVYYNPTTPTLTGASFAGFATPAFAAPHTYGVSGFIRTLNAGTTGYFIITANIAATADVGHTVTIDGGANAVQLIFSTTPTLIDNQSNVAGTKTIVQPGITLSTVALPANNIGQGTTGNPVYILQGVTAGVAVNVNSLQVTLSGSYDDNDLTTTSLYYNPTVATVSGATLLKTLPATFAGPHVFLFDSFNQGIASGAGGYFIVTINADNAATNGNTINVNGAVNPASPGFVTTPNIVDNQSNVASAQTIQAGAVTLTTNSTPAGSLIAGSTNNILYIAKLALTNQPATVNSLQVTLSGTHDNDDLGLLSVYYNPTAPALSGSTLISSLVANFAAPHDYNFTSFTRALTAGSTGYFIVTINVANFASVNNTVFIDGAAHPLLFGFVTSPVITNSQTNASGVQTITTVLPVRFISFTGQQEGDNVLLKWATGSENLNSHFEIETSQDGISFSNIGNVNGNGTTASRHDYSFVHLQPVTGNNFYRLKQVDIDNNFTYSPVINVIVNKNGSITVQLYPLPASSVLHYKLFANEAQKVNVTISDLQGKRMSSGIVDLTTGNNSGSLDVQNLESGIYLVQFHCLKTNATINTKIIIQR